MKNIEPSKTATHPIFSVLGIEIEYMVVDKTTLDINPIVDKLFQTLSGKINNEISRGPVALNNELALHVVELKTNGPSKDMCQAHEDFYTELKSVSATLDQFDAMLMPTGMHPWLTPLDGIKLWPHGDKAIYETYNKIFNCKGHGWSNLQSVHINMPFANESEFTSLNNAIRIVLPLTPALYASTPICESKKTGVLSTRMIYYINNQKKIPSISGDIIPDYVNSIEAYHQDILQPMYEAIRPYDPKCILQEEWLNSRGAIARFERDAIEIRVVDAQECAKADFATVAVIAGIIQYIVENTDAYVTKPLPNNTLKSIMLNTIENGLNAEIQQNYKAWLEQLGLRKSHYSTVRHVINALIERSIQYIPKPFHEVIEFVLSNGNLADRIIYSLGKNFSTTQLRSTYQQLCECLITDQLFKP